MISPIDIIRGDSPVVLGLPHTGTYVPAEVAAKLNARGRGLDDTDWHIDRLYEGLLPDVTSVRAVFHRYVIDANRDPSGVSLYPGQNTTTLVPLTDFDGHPIWDQEPDAAEIGSRCREFHAPYHRALEAELARVKAIHGFAILYDCHSIRSTIPFLFEGVLPDFNTGTNMGRTCDPALEEIVVSACTRAKDYRSVVNGRFKGGWTTRHYGRPDEGLHAIQMELAQSTYLTREAAPWVYDQTKANRLRENLHTILTRLADWAPQTGGNT